MNFELNEEQNLIRETVRDFAVNEIAPSAKERDEEERFDRELMFDKLGELGLTGIVFPEQYGGAGADYISYAIAVEELSRVCASTGVTLSAHLSLCANPIYMFGTEEQKQQFLVPLAEGSKMGAFGLTETSAGSDAGGTKTTAVLDGDEWVLNGSKIFITNGKEAEVYIILARTDKEAQKHHGISAFIIENDFPGFVVGTKEKKLGVRASGTFEIVFEDCEVPAENLLGGVEGGGFGAFMKTLQGGRISIGAMALGIAQASLDASIEFGKDRKQFGRAIADFQATKMKLADMATGIHAARLMIYDAAARKERGEEFGRYASMCKLFASELAIKAADHAVQIHGGFGYCREYHVERYYRDAKLTEIGEGTSEIQRIVIARDILQAS